ncbi:MAG: exodeoxyribonuclease VII large subunit [Gemmatimonadaceae bacterium]|nr:exodeoxyribonuclease VII large subunit [Gemmatimonadaceae bacterium]
MRYRDGNTPFESSRRQYATGPTTAAPGASRVTAVSISELNNATKALVEGSFGRFWVRGEVSDFKPHRNGHWYFCLRDSAAQMACVVWNSDQRAIPALPDDGMQVVALAQMTLFPARGSLQLRITRIEAAGDGLWRKAMQLTVKRLTAEGLLADERKRPMPRFPRCIAVVTSTSGAALKDITSVARRRRPGIRIIISAAAVQGESAPLEICAAIARVVRWGGADVVIVGRGGGSREDLWAFNDERVARAVASCPVPVISAVGHEIDITVCDLVADLRAATPSAAAETAIPALDDLMAAIRARRSRLRSAVSERMRAASLDIRTAAKNMRAASIRATERRRAHVATTAGRLNALSPLATLERGYAVARSVSGETLSSVEQFEGGMAFELMLRDGFIAASVDRVRLNTDGTDGQ